MIPRCSVCTIVRVVRLPRISFHQNTTICPSHNGILGRASDIETNADRMTTARACKNSSLSAAPSSVDLALTLAPTYPPTAGAAT